MPPPPQLPCMPSLPCMPLLCYLCPLHAHPFTIPLCHTHTSHARTPSPTWTEWMTHACENITFLQLRSRAVIMISNYNISSFSCSSYVGMSGGRQPVTLAPGCRVVSFLHCTAYFWHSFSEFFFFLEKKIEYPWYNWKIRHRSVITNACNWSIRWIFDL